MFPEDFFGAPNQFKTIQTQISKNKEHPKIINPSLIKTKNNQPYIIEIKEEKCEESMDMTKNKNALKIIIPQNISTEEISTSGGSYNTPNTPNNPAKPIYETEPNKNKKKGSNIKDKLISNNELNKNLQNINNNNSIKDENIDLYYPMAFTFNFKEKKNRTINNNKRMVYKYNKSFETNKKRNENSKDKDKLKDKKRKGISYQKNNDNKNIKDNKYQRNHSLKNYNIKENKNKSNNKYTNSNYGYKKSYSCEKNDYKHKNERNMKRNNTSTEPRKYTRNNSGSQYNRKSKSAKKNKDTINIISIKNNKNILKRNVKDDKKGLYNKNNLRNFKSEYDNKKKEIVHSKVKNEINRIFQNLPENYEKFPEINNKFELLMKNINDFKFVLDKKSKNIYKK